MSRYLVFGLSMSASTNTTAANAQEIATAFRAAFPTGKMMWSFTDFTGHSAPDQQYLDLRAFVQTQVDTFGDGVAWWAGFSCTNVDNTAAAKGHMDAAVPGIMGRFGYATPCIMAWHLPAPILSYARSQYGIKTVIAQTWAQSGVDSFTGEGGPQAPYYPSVNNTLTPAQAEANRIDTVLLNFANKGFWEGTLDGAAGQVTVHPVDCVTLLRAQQITNEHLASSDPMGLITNVVELDWINDSTSTNVQVRDQTTGALIAKQRLKDWLAWLPTAYPDMQAVTVPQFGDLWRAQHPTNDWAIAQSGVNPSDATQAVHWNITAKRRVAVLTTSAGVQSLDWTPYSDATTEPVAPATNWTLPQRVSQKSTAQYVNPTAVIPYRELEPLYRGQSSLAAYRRK